MKHIALPVALMLLILLAGIANTKIADSRLGNIIDTLNMAQEYVEKGDWDTAEQLARRAMQDWRDSKTYLSIISRHSELDEINATANRAMESVLCRDDTLFRTENAVLIGMIEHIYEMEQLSLENIL